MKKLFVSLIMLTIVLACAGCGEQSKDGMLATGRKLSAERNYKGAIVVFKTMLEKYPRDREARRELAWAYLHTGKANLAEKEARELLAEHKENSVTLLLGDVKLAQGLPEEAGDLARSVLASDQANSEAWELLGKSQAQRGDLAQAEQSFASAWKLSPSRTASKLGLVDIALRQGDEDRADKELGELLDAAPDNQVALHLQASRLLAKGKYDQAISTYGKLIGLGGNDLRARYQEAFLRLMVRDDQVRAGKVAPALIKAFPNRPEGYKLQGLLRLRDKRYSEAVDTLQTAIKLRPDLDSHYFLAVTYDKSGKPEMAVSELNSILDANPKDIRTRSVLAQIYMRQGRLDEAVQEARKALEISPDDPASSSLLGDALFAQRDYDQALSVFNRMAEVDNKPASVLYKQGLVLSAKGDSAGAEDMFRRSLSEDPGQIASRLLLASSLAKRQDFDEAVTLLSQGPAQGPDGASMRVAMAGVALMRQRFDEAEALLAEARDMDPQAVEAVIRLASLKSFRGDKEGALKEYRQALVRHPDNTRLLLAAAGEADALKRPAEVRELLETAKNTKDVIGYMALARYLARGNDRKGALAVLDECLEKRPGSIQALQAKVLIMESMGDKEGALSALKTLETLNQPLGWSEKVRYYLSIKDYEKAREAADKYIVNQPDQAASYMPMAQVLEAMGDLPGSEGMVRKALAVQPNNAVILVDLAKVLARQKRFPEALDACRSALSAAPGLPQANLALGMIAQSAGRDDEAVTAYEAVLKANPKQGEALNNLAMLYAQKPDMLERAGVLASAAYSVLGEQAPVIDTLGFVLFKQGRYAEAVELLDKAAKMAPDNPEIAEHLAQAQKRGPM